MHARDIDHIIAAAMDKYPQLRVEQLRVKYSADDDGLWIFTHPDSPYEVQLESSHGVFPFIVETDHVREVKHAHSISDALQLIESWLGIGSRTA